MKRNNEKKTTPTQEKLRKEIDGQFSSTPVVETPEPLTREPEALTQTKLTADEERLASMIMDADTDWHTIREDELTDYSLGDEPYPLPDEAKKLQDNKEFAFRWILNDWTRLQEIMRKVVPFRWWPCNSTNTPYLKKDIDRTDGAVHCQDQILVFKPWWMHQRYKDLVSGESAERDKREKLAAKHGMVEEDGSEWSTGKEARIGGRDEVMQVADDV